MGGISQYAKIGLRMRRCRKVTRLLFLLRFGTEKYICSFQH